VRAQSTWNLYADRSHIAGMATLSTTPPVVTTAPAHNAPRERLPVLMLGAIGVVYGDIGTSPLYALKESFIGPHPLAVDRLHIFGVLSLIVWSLMLIVTVKYVFVAMRADNRGEAARSRCLR
jgi:KUP system potassium uptake protein